MAAYVNRTISMMAGDGPHNVAMLNNGAVRVNMSNVDSPLQIFVRAKKKINDIFVEIDDYVKDAVTFMHGKQYLFIYFLTVYRLLSIFIYLLIRNNLHCI